MDEKQIDNQTEEVAPQEFKTNTARYVMFIVFLVDCVLAVHKHFSICRGYYHSDYCYNTINA
jgi:hypothetical protein